MKNPTIPKDKRCESQLHGALYRCSLEKGHEGPHKRRGYEWK